MDISMMQNGFRLQNVMCEIPYQRYHFTSRGDNFTPASSECAS